MVKGVGLVLTDDSKNNRVKTLHSQIHYFEKLPAPQVEMNHFEF